MKRNRRGLWGRLQTQIIIFYVTLSLLVFSVIGTVSYVTSSHGVKRQAEQMLLQNFKQIEDSITTYLEDVEKLARELRVEQTFQDFWGFRRMEEKSSVLIARNLLQSIDNVLNNYPDVHSALMFGEDGTYFGASRVHTMTGYEQAQLPIYSSASYAMVQQQFPDIVWTDEQDMRQLLGQAIDADRQVVSALTYVSNFYASRRSAVLVLNIDETSLRSAYNFPWQDEAIEIDIVNTDGRIFSSQNPERIGAMAAEEISIPPGELYARITAREDGEARQIIFYQIQKTGWYIAADLPANYFTRGLDYLPMLVTLSFLASMLLIVPIYIYWISRKLAPLKELAGAMKNMGKGELGHVVETAPSNEIGVLISSFNEMSINIKELMQRTEEAEQAKTKMEIHALQSQINPHFLYNTLNTVKWMATVINAENIAECVVALNRLLHPVFSSQATTHTVEEELDYLQNYITILNFRYGNNIRFSIDVDENILRERIIRFILQPLVENAVTHGFVSNETGVIGLKAETDGENLIFTVADSGVGISEMRLLELRGQIESGQQPGEGIGLQNVNQRIRLHFGPAYGLQLDSAPGGGARIRVVMPRTM